MIKNKRAEVDFFALLIVALIFIAAFETENESDRCFQRGGIIIEMGTWLNSDVKCIFND